MYLLNLVVVVLAIIGTVLAGHEAALSNARQTSTMCYKETACHNASNAIDGVANRDSRTEWRMGTQWWEASITNMKVSHVLLTAATFVNNATVGLYRGEKLVGSCDTYTRNMHWQSVMLRCENVIADSVRLTVTPDQKRWATYLIIKEIHVIGEEQKIKLDVATVKQSSVSHGGDAVKAVDGNNSGQWSSRSCACTTNRGNNWWSVGLNSTKSVSSVVIYNRLDCCQQRIDGAKVYVGDVECGEVAYVANVSKYRVQCNGAVGSDVKITLNDEYLTLCEVEVFGLDADEELVKRGY